MKRPYLVPLSGLFLLSCIHCSSRKTANQAKTLTFDEDVKAVQEACAKVKTAEEQVQISVAFLNRNKKRPEVMDIIESIAISGYLQGLKDPKRMMAFAREQTANISDPKLRRQTDLLFVKLCGEIGDQDGLRKHIQDFQSKGALSLNKYQMISDAALKAKDWQTTQQYLIILLQRNTPTTIRSEVGNKALSEQEIRDAIDRNRIQALLGIGKALTIKGDYDAAIASYKEASQLVTYNYTGYPNYPYWDYHALWAKTLLQKGDYKGAIEKIAVEAIIFEQEDAQELLKKAYASAKLGNDLEGFTNRTRTRIAKAVPELHAIGYDGKKVTYRNLKGRVTLVSLWSPSCGPCRDELPRLRPIYEALHPRGLDIVVVDDLNDTKNALKFIKETGLPYQFFEAGPKKETIEQGLFETTNPTSYLIDKKGKLVYAHHGYLDGDEEKLRRIILQFLNN